MMKSKLENIEERFVNQLKTNKGKVEFLLENYPQLRDSDKLLWLAYLNIFGNLRKRMNNSSDPYNILKNVLMDSETPTMETITRLRRKFQENGHYVGKNRDLRLKNASNVKKWACGNK